MNQLKLGDDPLREDEVEAVAAAEEGMDKAIRAERVTVWKINASAWLEIALVSGEEFTADDLVRVVGLPDIGPSRNNVVGAWFSGQARVGNIIFCNRMRRSKRVVRHGNAQRVWRKA